MPYYVSPTGSDGFTAAQAQNPATPWQTPRKALMTAPSGEVQIRNGSYARVNCATDVLSKASPLTVRPYPGEAPSILGMSLGTTSNVIFDGLNFDAYCYFGRFSPNPVLPISNVAVRNCIFDMHNVAEACMALVASTGVVVEGNMFKNAIKPGYTNLPADGINVRSSSETATVGRPSGLIIRNNRFENLDQDGLTFNVGSDNTLVEGNVFDNVANISKPFSDGVAHNDGIACYGTATGMVIRRNTWINGQRGIFFHTTSVYNGVVIENNLIVPETTDFNIRMAGFSSGAKIVNNTMWSEVTPNPATSGLDIGGNNTAVVLKNNIIHTINTRTPSASFAVKRHNVIAVGALTGGTDNAGNVQGSPTFVDAANDDYRLAAGDTLAKNLGDTTLTDVPKFDRDGYSRPIGARYDIGAYEYAGVPSKALTDSVTVTDAMVKTLVKRPFDSVTPSDALTKAATKQVTEVALVADDILIAETDADEIPVALADSVTVTDSVRKTLTKSLTE